MAYKGALMVDDATLFRAMQQAAEHGLLIMVHAENGDAIDILVAEALAAGHTEPKYHALTRPPELEAEATNRAIRLAEVAGAPLYVVHVTNAGAVEAIRAGARARRADLRRDLRAILLLHQGRSGAARLRGREVGLLAAVPREDAIRRRSGRPSRTNDLQVISTDHCDFWFEGGKDGRTAGKELGKGDFSKIPNGVPGIEDRMMVLYTQGVRGGRFSLNRWVELCCANPAKLFGVYPQKGVIAPGSDADIVIWDPEATHTISAEDAATSAPTTTSTRA